MQRVRVGLTGLACVFLLVFLAAAFFGLARSDTADPVARDPASLGIENNSAAEPREPLAELGVTPGNVPGEPESPADAPASHAPALPAAPAAPAPAPPAR